MNYDEAVAALAEIRDPSGARRFYPPGQHPAMARLREARERIDAFEDRHGETSASRAYGVFVDRRIAEFETGEIRARSDALARILRAEPGGTLPDGRDREEPPDAPRT